MLILDGNQKICYHYEVHFLEVHYHNEMHFLADVDRIVRELRENNTDGEKLCEIELSAKWYAMNVRETPMDR